MKKTKLLIFPLILTLFGTGCSNSKISIKQKENIDSFVYVDNQELTTLINNKQDFILVVGEKGCSTCDIIKPVLVDYIKKYEYIVYWVETNNYQRVVDSFVNSDYVLRPDIMSATILLFDNGSTKDIIEYNDNLYYSESKLELTLENKVRKSNIYCLNTLNKFIYSSLSSYPDGFHMYKFDYSSTNDLDKYIDNKSKINVLYSWGPCPDCIKVYQEIDEYMISTNSKLYYFEVSYFRDNFATDSTLFADFAHKYEFDNYRGGKVPTIVTYTNKDKSNMFVYLNDEVTKVDDQYVITNSNIPELVNTSYSSKEKLIEVLREVHKEKLIEYLENNLK